MPIMHRLMAECRSPNFTIPLLEGDVLNFWDINKCDLELGKVNYK
jgi:hypothetical protein